MYMVMFCPLCVLCAVFVFVYYVVWCCAPLCVYVLCAFCMSPYCCVVCVLYVTPVVLCVLYVTPIAHMCVYVFMECVCCLCINKLCVTVVLCPAAPYEWPLHMYSAISLPTQRPFCSERPVSVSLCF